MSLPSPILYDPSRHSHLLPKFAQIHCAVVENDHTLATFLPPFTNGTDQRVLDYWKSQEPEIIAGTRITVMQMMPSGVGNEDILTGYVSLDMPPSETGPFRGIVQKLLVDPKFRRKGIARRLMEKLEEMAREKGRSLLVLDTEVGSAAESVYPRLGYQVIGIVPKYGISPRDGRLVDEVFFYKDLKDHRGPQ